MSKPYSKNDVPLTPERIAFAHELLDHYRRLEEHGRMHSDRKLRRRAQVRTMETIGVSTPSSTGAHPERRRRTSGVTA